MPKTHINRSEEYKSAKIEKGIPVPIKRRTEGTHLLLAEMQLGDSVELSLPAAKSLQSALKHAKFNAVLRATTPGKARVWKMSPQG